MDKETLKAPVAGGGLNVAIQKSDIITYGRNQ